MVWTTRERREYTPLAYAPLQLLYREARLPIDNPEARAKYLAEQVLSLTQMDHAILMHLADEKGKAVALRHLEEMLQTAHLHIVADARQKISLPLNLPV